jgi:hypothetical protein
VIGTPANCTRFAINEKREQIEHHKDNMVVKEGRVDGLWNQQHRNQPLEAVHRSTDTVTKLSLGLQLP